MNFRHEWKHEINVSDMIALRQRLRTVAKPDIHAVNGKYTIRSLYFDSLSDKALREKLDGVNLREKFRLRYYNGDASVIHLEKKSKCNGLGRKQTAVLTCEQVQGILSGGGEWMMEQENELVRELYCKIKLQGLCPRTIVDYTREPFVYEPGNVRVTIDYDIRTGLGGTEFLDSSCVTIPAGNAPILLEVKWDSLQSLEAL
jgi:hypothetical protein